MVVIPKHLVIFLFNPLNNSLKSALQFLLNYVLAYRAEIMKIVSVSKYILTLPYMHTTSYMNSSFHLAVEKCLKSSFQSFNFW